MFGVIMWRNITLTATDIDSDPLTFEIVQSPSHGIFLDALPSLTYTPDTNYQGTDSFTFKANDGKEDSNIATVNINIKPPSTERHFEEVDGNPADATWTIYLSSAALDGMYLQMDDEIAVFDNDTLVGSYKITEILTQENQLNNYLTAWSTLSDGSGYNAGNFYTIKCWDASEQKEYICANPVLNNSYEDAYTGTTFPQDDGKYSIVNLSFETTTIQTIALINGYQFVSLNIQPENTEMTEILSNILDNVDFVKDSKSNMLRKIGPNWINNIGQWETIEGYLIRMKNNAELNVEGMSVNPETQISLKTGYQFAAYLPTEPIDAQTAFSNILDNLDFVKDSKSNMLRKIGPNWVNNIGNLNPGQGYLLKMKADDVLQYPNGSRIQRKAAYVRETQSPEHFGEIIGNAADDTWTIYLSKATIDKEALEPGDEIAIFDGEKLVGAYKLTETLTEDRQFDNFLTAWATLNNGDGYTSGNKYKFKCWDASEGIELSNFEVVFMDTYEDEYAENVFPDEDGQYSIVEIVFFEEECSYGDLNIDGKIDLKDVIILLKMVIGID